MTAIDDLTADELDQLAPFARDRRSTWPGRQVVGRRGASGAGGRASVRARAHLSSATMSERPGYVAVTSNVRCDRGRLRALSSASAAVPTGGDARDLQVVELAKLPAEGTISGDVVRGLEEFVLDAWLDIEEVVE